MLPMADDLTRRAAVRYRAALSRLARRHMIEHVLHCFAVRQRTVHLTVALRLPPLALMRVKQQHQLLLDELALLGVYGQS